MAPTKLRTILENKVLKKLELLKNVIIINFRCYQQIFASEKWRRTWEILVKEIWKKIRCFWSLVQAEIYFFKVIYLGVPFLVWCQVEAKPIGFMWSSLGFFSLTFPFSRLFELGSDKTCFNFVMSFWCWALSPRIWFLKGHRHLFYKLLIKIIKSNQIT